MSRVKAVISETATKPEHTKPPMPLNLSTLQQICARRFGYKAKETLDIMQGLYETHKLLTYPRTDNRYLSDEHFTRLAILPTLSARRYQSWRPRPLAWIKRKT